MSIFSFFGNFQSAPGTAPLSKFFDSLQTAQKKTTSNIVATLRSSPDVLTIGEHAVASRTYKQVQSPGTAKPASNNAVRTPTPEQETVLPQTHETPAIITSGRFGTNTIIAASKTAENKLTHAFYNGDSLIYTMTSTTTYEQGKGWIENNIVVEFTPEGQAWRKDPSGYPQLSQKVTLTIGGEVVFQENGTFLAGWISGQEAWSINRALSQAQLDTLRQVE